MSMRTSRSAIRPSQSPLEALEPRTMFVSPGIDLGTIFPGGAFGPSTIDLGTLSPATVANSSFATLTRNGATETRYDRYLAFEVTNPSSLVTINLSSVEDSATAGASVGSLRVGLIRDLDGDKVKDAGEFVDEIDYIPHTPGAKVVTFPQLPAGDYFIEMRVDTVFGGANPQTGTIDWDLTAKATALPAPAIQVKYAGVTIADNDTTPSLADGTDFGSVPLGAPPVDHVFTVTNTGNATLSLTDNTLEFPGFDLLGLPLNIPAGGSGNFTVRLLTNAVGARADTPYIGTNIPGLAEFNFKVAGFVAGGAHDSLGMLNASPKDSYGTVAVTIEGDTHGNHFANPQEKIVGFALGAQNDVTIKATATDNPATVANGDLRLMLVRDQNGNGQLDQSEYSTPLLNQIAVSGSGQKTYNANGLAAGSYFLHMSIANFATGGGDTQALVDYALQLTSAAAAGAGLAVNFGDTPITDGDASPDGADGTAFGTTTPGSAGIERTFTVSNTGGGSLTLGAISVPAGFEVVAGLPPTLAAGASASFKVKLLGSGSGPYSGDVSFSTNAPGMNPFNFAVSGTVGGVGGDPGGSDPSASDFLVSSVDAAIAPVVVGGDKKAKGKATVLLSSNAADKISGNLTINVFASTDGAVDAADLLLGTTKKNVSLKPGQTKSVKVKLLAPATSADTDFLILANAGGTSVGQAPAGVRIEQPRVELIGLPSSFGPQAWSFGKKVKLQLPIQDAGNTDAKGNVHLELFASTDGTTNPATSFLLADIPAAKASIKAQANGSIKTAFTLPDAFPAPFAAGNYTLLARLTANAPLADLNTTNGQVVASVPFSIA